MDFMNWFIQNEPDLVAKMKTNEHCSNAPYHREGSVWTHTCMAYAAAKAQGLNFIFETAAVLHDIGKTKTRTEVDGKIRFIGHEGTSFFMAERILRKYSKYHQLLDNEAISDILTLIAIHGEFKEAYNAQTHKLDQRIVHFFNRFRLLDRIANIHEQQSLPIRLKQPQPLVESSNTITYLIGLPGSGKSSYANTLPTHLVVSRDTFIESYPGSTYQEKWQNSDQTQIDKLFHAKLRQVYQDHNSVIIDATNLTKKGRTKLRNIITNGTNAPVSTTGIIIPTDLDICIERRSTGLKTVNANVITQMSSKFTFPYELDTVQFILKD